MRDIRNEIEKINELIPLPTVIMEVLLELNKKDVAIQKLSQLILNDAALTSNILRIVNSPLYGFANKVTDISHAMVLLGLEEVTRLLITFYMRQRIFSLNQTQKDYLELQWRHSVCTGSIARTIATEYKIPTKGKEFIGGLLHDMGRLVIIQYFPSELTVIQRMIHELEFSDIEAESQVLAVSHTEVSAFLGNKWNLPGDYTEIMRFHHTPRQALLNPLLVALVRFADLLAEEMNYGIKEREGEYIVENDDSYKMLLEHVPALREKPYSDLRKHLRELIEQGDSYFHMFR